MKTIRLFAYKLTSADIAAGKGNSLPNGSIIWEIDTNGVPTGKTYTATGSSVVEGSGQLKNNYSATAAPTTSNNFAQGYSVGSRWIDTTNDESYICTGDGEWSKTTVGTIAEVAGLQTALDAKSATSHNHDTAYEPKNTNIQTHISSTTNPHSVTKTQVGLGSVDNTADSAKPVSTAQQTALDAKQATLVNQTNIKSINNISLLGSGDLVVLAQGLKLIDTIAHLENFTSNTNGSYIASASSEFDTNYQAHKAFDGVATSDWATQGVTSNFWIKLQLPAARAIHRFIAKGRNSNEHMQNWRFEGSNDNVNWTTLDSDAGTISLSGVDRTFSNTTKYLYYRLYSISGTGTNPGLSELRLFGKEYSFDNFVV